MQVTLSLPVLVQLAVLILASLVVSLLVSPISIAIARRLGLIDRPGAAAHKKHAAPTPLAGGITLIISLVILLTLFNLWEYQVFLLVMGAVVIFIFGALDDRFGFSAWQKLTGQVTAGVILISADISVHFMKILRPVTAEWVVDALHWGITLFWVIGITNAFNLTDSMDGLTSGLAAISAGFYTLFSLVSGQAELAGISAVLFGVAISLYAVNITPAFSFLGDSGAQTLGFLLAAIGILYTPNNLPQGSTWFVPILLVGVPIFDTTLVTFSRLRRHKPVFNADLAHTYHRLVRLGMAPNQAVLVLQVCAFLLSNLAFIAFGLPPIPATTLFLLLCALGAGGIFLLERYTKID